MALPNIPAAQAPVFTPALVPTNAPAPAFPAIVPPKPINTEAAIEVYAPQNAQNMFSGENNQLSGEWSRTDVTGAPWLSICQATSKSFNNNAAALGKYTVAGEAVGADLLVIPIRAEKYYLEDLPYGSPVRAQRFNTREAAKASGVKFISAAIFDLLIRVSVDHPCAEFSDGTYGYFPAKYDLKGGAYFTVSGAILGAAMKPDQLNGDIAGGIFKFTIVRKSKEINGKPTSWYAPEVKLEGRTDETTRNFIRAECGV